MFRKLIPWFAVLVGIAVVWIGTQYVASESGEVVVLRTVDAAGAVQETRLWVVDHDGSQWLRAGNSAVGWYQRLAAHPEVEVVRDEAAQKYRAVPEPEARDAINDRMNQKYGWADSYIRFWFGPEKKIAVRLVPINPAP